MQRLRTFRLAAMTGLVILLAGCADDDGIDFGSTPQQGSATAASPTPSAQRTLADQQAVLKGYNAYWTTYDTTAAQPSSDKTVVSMALSAVATDPLLTSSTEDIVNAALAGQKAYGSYVVHPKTPVFQDASNTEALITDCIDSSKSGWANADGQPLTVGVPAVSSRATMVKGVDGIWRMAQVTFDDQVTCL